jgi:hypothetical protein
VPARALMGRNRARVAARTRSKPKIRNISGPDSDRILRTALDIETMVQRLTDQGTDGSLKLISTIFTH